MDGTHPISPASGVPRGKAEKRNSYDEVSSGGKCIIGDASARVWANRESRYLAERTTILIPRLFGYGFGGNHPTGLPFMLIEYIEGAPLSTVDLVNLGEKQRAHLYGQLADILIQLRLQEFDHIGSLTLDEHDKSWIFADNRPLTIDINDHQIGGLDAASIVGPQRTHTSTIDYVYTLMQLVFNQFHLQRNSIYHEEDARRHVYGLRKFHDLLMGWVRPEYNNGPFILMHGDFRRSNIMVDQNLNITAVIDWEWSRTTPVQLFMPPAWLRGCEVDGLLSFRGIRYMDELSKFRNIVKTMEENHYRPENEGRRVPLSKLWSGIDYGANFFIAHALLRFDVLGDIYWDDLDRRYHGRDPEGRVKSFYEAQATKDLVVVVERKLQELEIYKKELADRGMEIDQPRKPLPTLSPDNAQRLAAFLKDVDKEEKCTKHVNLRSCQSSLSSFMRLSPLPW
jgi:hypothetical protein